MKFQEIEPGMIVAFKEREYSFIDRKMRTVHARKAEVLSVDPVERTIRLKVNPGLKNEFEEPRATPRELLTWEKYQAATEDKNKLDAWIAQEHAKFSERFEAVATVLKERLGITIHRQFRTDEELGISIRDAEKLADFIRNAK